jgi:hypothetical protein
VAGFMDNCSVNKKIQRRGIMSVKDQNKIEISIVAKLATVQKEGKLIKNMVVAKFATTTQHSDYKCFK